MRVSYLGGHVADPVGAVTNVLGCSDGTRPEFEVSKGQFDLKGTALFVGYVAGFVVAPDILSTTIVRGTCTTRNTDK